MLGLWDKIAKAFGKSGKELQNTISSIDQVLGQGNDNEILIAVSEGVQRKINASGIDGLTQAERVFHYVYLLEAEVNNGGFDQYFFNSAGNHTQEVIGALEEIGANYTAQLVRDAIGVFPGGTAPRDRNQRQEILLEMGQAESELLNQVDSKFYEYRDDLSALMIAFVKQCREQFGLWESPPN